MNDQKINNQRISWKASPSELQVMKWYDEYKNGKSLIILAEENNKTIKFFQHHFFKRFKLEKVKFSHKELHRYKENTGKYKNKNVTFFDVIDSEIKAYLLGFIFADGCISKSRLIVGVNVRDIYIINLLQKFLNKENHLYFTKKTNAVDFGINSLHLINSLKIHGVKYSKSLKENYIPNIPSELKRHFIRGYFDGDGCIRQKSDGFCIDIVSKTKSILTDIYNEFIKYDITTSITFNKTTTCWNLRKSKKEELLKIKDYFYKDADYYFSRKFDIFNKIIPR